MKLHTAPVLLLLLCSSAVFAHGAHVHSISNGTLAIDQNQIEFTFQSPGANMVGFEHPPRNQDQQAAFDLAVTILESAEWITFDSEAGCSDVAVEVNTPGFHDEQHDHDHPDHEHEHELGDHDHEHHADHEHGDHNHDHDHGSRHAEIHLTLRAACSEMDRLNWITFDLFDGWSDNQEIQLDVLTDRIQQRFVLTADNNRLELN